MGGVVIHKGRIFLMLSIACMTSCTQPDNRKVTFKLPAPLLAMGKSKLPGDIHSMIITDSCNYNLGVTCVAIPADGSAEYESTPDAQLECRFDIPKGNTYQLFLKQFDTICAEILQSASFTPTLVGKSELDFDIGQLVEYVNGTLHEQNDIEYNSDTDGDFIADALDPDLDGNGILDVNEDCDQDGLPNSVDVDVDGDSILNKNDPQTVCVTL